jgi:hypothetical protein
MGEGNGQVTPIANVDVEGYHPNAVAGNGGSG